MLTNGAIAAAVFVDAIVRLLPGVLGDERSAEDDSFSLEQPSLEAPQYTRPSEFRGWRVPEILLSGNHGEIAKWRKEQALNRMRENRPDLVPGNHFLRLGAELGGEIDQIVVHEAIAIVRERLARLPRAPGARHAWVVPGRVGYSCCP